MLNVMPTTQLVTRVPVEIVEGVDHLVKEGTYESRSEAVREALAEVIDRHRRIAIGEAIVDGYRRIPQDRGRLSSGPMPTPRP